MLIRLKNKSKAMELTSQEFEEMVKKGRITPDSLVKNKFIANGSWVSVTNLEMFHRFSTVEHPPGPYLLERDLYGTFLEFSDLFSSKSFHPCFSTICRSLIVDSLAVEKAIFIFFDIETALIPSSRVPQ